MQYDYDLLVIGGGSAGLNVASGCAQLGVKTLLIDKYEFGGDCLHHGCVPSKTLLKSAKVAHQMRTANNYGIQASEPTVVWSDVIKRIDDIKDIIQEHDSDTRFRKLGAHVLYGTGTFVDSHTVEITLTKGFETRQEEELKCRIKEEKIKITAKKIVIATGSRPRHINLPGLTEAGFITNEDVFSLKKQPESLAIIGAGPIGCEMAQAFSRLGTKVTLLVRDNQILRNEDADVAQLLEDKLIKEGITILKQSQTEQVTKNGDTKTLHYKQDNQIKTVNVTEILLAVGRTPNIEKLNLEAANVTYKKNHIPVNKKLQTSQKNIFALGDVNGTMLFTHTAAYEAGVFVSGQILKIPFTKTNYQTQGWATYTDPELASIGYNEKRAKAANIKYTTINYTYKIHDRALAESTNYGFIKLLISPKNKLLGAQIVGPNAGEVIHEYILVHNTKMPLSKFTRITHLYPTIAESTRNAVGLHFSPKLFNSKVRKVLRMLFGYRGIK